MIVRSAWGSRRAGILTGFSKNLQPRDLFPSFASCLVCPKIAGGEGVPQDAFLKALRNAPEAPRCTISRAGCSLLQQPAQASDDSSAAAYYNRFLTGPDHPPVFILLAKVSAMARTAAWIGPAVRLGMTEASTTKRLSSALSRRSASTGASVSRPILQVPQG